MGYDFAMEDQNLHRGEVSKNIVGLPVIQKFDKFVLQIDWERFGINFKNI